MTRRIVLALVGAVVLAMVAVGYGVLTSAREHTTVAAANALSLVGPRIMFRSTAPDSKGHLALVAKDDPDGPRSVSALGCLRVYAAAGTGACLRQDGALTTFQIAILDRNLNVEKAIPLVGVPNRTRVSGDGRLVAWTVFVAGDSYNHGRFSTRAGLIDLRSDDMVDSLEFLSVTLDGHPYTAPDLNFWGITFAADDNLFYATMSTGGNRYLVEGDIAAKTVRTIAKNVECPSLSPDGTRIAFKSAIDGDPAKGWRLSVLDLASGTRTPLAEARSVDDQPAWLDANTIGYSIPRGTGDSDVWVVPADGSGSPRLLIPHAESPAALG
ncbi:WD40 repeat protein [Kribbella pratensis]|uniref:WD40 repeat protein n=1 Tax=Kribbella pratensis TaxID=2512112 RepID=A0ABY2FKX5_9ACTN|nr:PD40 domain-containing protein [Kribbella pratensis]TDW93427.1 WD40 repeat protein [Kribbella pratensis]